MDFLSDPDVALMLRVREGDRAAFDVLIVRYRKPLLNIIARTIGRDADAEDLAQDVFVRVYRSAPRYQPTAKFSTWLYTIARRVCLNHARAQTFRRWFRLAGDDDSDDPPDDPPDPRTPDPMIDIERRELRRVVAQAVASLPERLRFAVVLRRYEELSYEEIAGILGCSVTAAKLRVHRANAILAERLTPYLKDSP